MLKKLDLYRQVAQLHMESINQGFLPTLGMPFMALMYRAIDESDDSHLFVDIQDDKVIGFISCTTSMGAIYKCMLRQWAKLGVALLPSLTRPHRIKRVAEVLRYGRKHPMEMGLPRAELLSIAVDPAYRGERRADVLYKSLMEHLRTQGESAFRITVGYALTSAHRFYRRMGAVPTAEIEVHSGERSTIYVQKLD